ncbi:DUF1648 domain-containing protein [Oceanobacillus picturae]|uniref:DUF1648 domain-containing protein n=1 Tax=Oceanobacillus picturae TaxID=171693 RepID=UPI000E6923FF|nr:DUF5808 domain-containing protein [Oceanobacillus picturae]RIU88797.1 DUF1648 domain-containing protein [Oceanobacillus picturae]
MTFILLLFFFIIVPVFIIMMFIPYLTRKTESFGVSIPEEIYHTNEMKQFRKKYAIAVGIVSLIVTIIFLGFGTTSDNETTLSILLGAIILGYLIISFFLYLHFHRQVKKRKAEEGWVKNKKQQLSLDLRFRRQKLSVSNLWFIPSFIIAFITAALSFIYYDTLPDTIPMQYDFSGNITNSADTSYRVILLMPIMQVFLACLFLFINIIITRAKQQIDADNPESSAEQNRVFRRRWSAFIVITSYGLTLLFSFIQYSFYQPIQSELLVGAPLVLTGGMIIAALLLSITTGQGGSRVRKQSVNNSSYVDRDDDRYWKLGQFYFNKNDPALFLEKRFGIGWTVNMARPLAWIMLLGIILLAAGIPILLSM